MHHRPRATWPLAIAALPMLAIVAVVVIGMLAGSSAGGSLASGRSVMTYSDSIFLSSKFSRDTATIETGGRTIVVQPTRLLIDGRTVATIDETVVAVEVRLKHGKVTFAADGRSVPTAAR